MLYDVTPSRKLTGGAWYSEQEFDLEFIEMLQKQVYHWVAKKVDNTFSKSHPSYSSKESPKKTQK